MEIPKLRLKDTIVVSLCATLIILPCVLFLMQIPTAHLVQSTFSGRLRGLIGANDTDTADNPEEDEFLGEETQGLNTSTSVLPPAVPPSTVSAPNATSTSEEIPGLADKLMRVATPDKTLIITTLNSAWAGEDSMIDLFLASFLGGERISHHLKNLLIVSLDQPSYDRCLAIHNHCFKLETEGVDFSAEKYFMTDDYLKMMWRRVEFLRVVLELGYNLLFTDADIMWFRDPFLRFSPDADFQIACDYYNGHPTDTRNLPNGGFVYVKSNSRTIDLYKFWYSERLNHPHRHDQDVFNIIKESPPFAGLKLRIRFLDTVYFGGFCQVSTDFSKVCTMHANCCTGLERKLQDLRLTIADWSRYKSLTPQQRKETKSFWQAPKECLLSW